MLFYIAAGDKNGVIKACSRLTLIFSSINWEIRTKRKARNKLLRALKYSGGEL